jgi:hypothetical protein
MSNPDSAISKEKKPTWRRFIEEAKAMLGFYWRWIKTGFKHSWSVTDSLATAAGLAYILIFRFYPHSRFVKMTDLLWQIPLGASACVVAARLILSPYWIYREKEAEALLSALDSENKQREIDELKRTIEGQTVQAEIKPKPRLEITVMQSQVNHLQNGIWVDGEPGSPFVDIVLRGLVAYVSNPPAPVGQRAAKAYGICATLNWKDAEGKPLGTVSKAYWLGAYANNLTLGSGDHRGLLLATFHDDHLGLWTNPRVATPQLGHSMRRWIQHLESQQCPVPSVVPFLQSGTVEISVVAIETGETIATGNVRVTKGEKGLAIENL